MAEIILVVTKPVLDHVSKGYENQSQIAMRSPSDEIEPIIRNITARDRKEILLGGCIKLVIGDTGAIWRAHNGQYLEDFDDLFKLLSRRPGCEMRFLCEIL